MMYWMSLLERKIQLSILLISPHQKYRDLEEQPLLMEEKLITYFSSCGIIGLPPSLAYSYYKLSIIKANEKGIEPEK